MLEADCQGGRLTFDGARVALFRNNAMDQSVASDIPLASIAGVRVRKPGLLSGGYLQLDVRDAGAPPARRQFAFTGERLPEVQAIHDAIVFGFARQARAPRLRQAA